MALDPAAWDEACRRRAAGESLRAIADTLGISASALRRKLAAAASAGPEARPKTKSKRKTKTKSKTKPKTKPSARSPATTPGGEDVRVKRRVTSSSPRAVRRQLIARLYRAIDTKLKLMERRMNSEIDAIDAGGNAASADDPTTAGRNSADHERETRAFGALVKTINSVRQMQAELDTLANAHTASSATNAAPSAADARLAADAERYRRDIAERLAKFVPPQS